MTTKQKNGNKKSKRDFKKAIHQEIREHKSSFIVFWILRLLIILTIVHQAFLGHYESVFYGILALLLIYLPSVIGVKFHIDIPPALEISILLFIYAAEILGAINAYYVLIPHWDTMLHTINGFLAAAIGFSMVVLLNDNEKLQFDLSPIFMASVAFTFSMTVGVVWEIFEFSMDRIFQMDTQKDTIVHAIHSVALNTNQANAPVSITDIHDVVVNGQSLGIDGYLDIGLIDTMTDLIVNLIGAICFSIIGYFFVKNQGKGKSRVAKFLLPSRKKTDRPAEQLTSTADSSAEAVSSEEANKPAETGESTERAGATETEELTDTDESVEAKDPVPVEGFVTSGERSGFRSP